MIGGVDRGRGLIWSCSRCREGKRRQGDFVEVLGKRCVLLRLGGGTAKEKKDEHKDEDEDEQKSV